MYHLLEGDERRRIFCRAGAQEAESEIQTVFDDCNDGQPGAKIEFPNVKPGPGFNVNEIPVIISGSRDKLAVNVAGTEWVPSDDSESFTFKNVHLALREGDLVVIIDCNEGDQGHLNGTIDLMPSDGTWGVVEISMPPEGTALRIGDVRLTAPGYGLVVTRRDELGEYNQLVNGFDGVVIVQGNVRYQVVHTTDDRIWIRGDRITLQHLESDSAPPHTPPLANGNDPETAGLPLPLTYDLMNTQVPSSPAVRSKDFDVIDLVTLAPPVVVVALFAILRRRMRPKL